MAYIEIHERFGVQRNKNNFEATNDETKDERLQEIKLQKQL